MEPDFTDMPFALAQVIDVVIFQAEGNSGAKLGFHVRVWPSFMETGIRTAYSVAVVPTFTEAYVIRDKVRALVRIARRLTGNIPP